MLRRILSSRVVIMICLAWYFCSSELLIYQLMIVMNSLILFVLILLKSTSLTTSTYFKNSSWSKIILTLQLPRMYLLGPCSFIDSKTFFFHWSYFQVDVQELLQLCANSCANSSTYKSFQNYLLNLVLIQVLKSTILIPCKHFIKLNALKKINWFKNVRESFYIMTSTYIQKT